MQKRDDPSLFISYAHEDRGKVKQIVEYLQLAEFDVWYDGKLRAGQDWEKEIGKYVKKCQIFIFVISQRSLSSEHCTKERAQATRLKKPILPIRVDETVTPESLPPELQKHQYIDALSTSVESIFPSLTGAIRRLPRENTRPPYLWLLAGLIVLAVVIGVGLLLLSDDSATGVETHTAEVLAPTLSPSFHLQDESLIPEMAADEPSPTFTFTPTFSPTPLPTCVPPLSEEQRRTATWESLVARQTQLARATQFPTTYPITATWEALVARQTQLSATRTGTPDCVP